jgi:MEMO1 family protein
MILGAYIMPHPPIIIPQIGKGEERKIQKTIDACKEVAKRIAALKPQTIVFTSPHSVLYADYFHISSGSGAKGSFSQFSAPQVKMEVSYDEEFVKHLCNLAERSVSENSADSHDRYSSFPAGTQGERAEYKALDHGVMVPLSFVNEQYTDYKLVRIGLSGLSPLEHYKLGKMITEVSNKLNRRVVFLASGDLSHKLTDDGPYGFSPDGPIFDKQVTEAMANADFLKFLTFEPEFCDSAAECGLRSFMIMAGALDCKDVKAELLSHEGPFGVGYGVAAFEVGGDNPARNFDVQLQEYEKKKMADIKSNEDIYVRLARFSLETYVRSGKTAKLSTDPGASKSDSVNGYFSANELPAEMLHERAGVFVSIHKDGQLRGCIGTIGPVTESIAREIIRNAVSAGTEDPRFDAVRVNELDKLVYSVDVLGPVEDIKDKSQLDVKRYGVIVSCGGRRGLLLPNLEGVDTVDYQIDIARQKGGIGKNEKYTLQRFEVVRHK